MSSQRNMFRKGWSNGARLAPGEIPHDPLMPHLGMLLDGEAMAGVMRDALRPTRSARLSEGGLCRVVNVRYRPGRQCIVNYALDRKAAVGGRPQSSIATAKIVSEAMAGRRLERRLRAARAAEVPIVLLPEYRMTISEFPHDLRVHGIDRVIDPDGLEAVVRRVLAAPEARLVEPDHGTPKITVVSYRPDRFCLVRFAIQRTPMSDLKEVIFARVYRDDSGLNVHETITTVWNSEVRRSGLLSVAEPLGYDPESRLLFQRAMPGVPLGEVAPCESLLDHVAASARSLATLHRSGLHVERLRSVDDEISWIELMAGGLAGVLPDAGNRMSEIASRLRRTQPKARREDWCLVHGDFSANQILARPGGVTLLDFDDAGMGDLYRDFGTFLARLEGRLKDQSDGMQVRAGEVFRQEYAAATGTAPDENRILWAQAVASVRSALSAIGQLKPGWPARLRGDLDRADALLDSLAAGSNVDRMPV